MSRIGLAVITSIALSSLLMPTDVQAQQPAQPNFMIILVDDMGWQDLSFYDIEAPTTIYQTPFLDSMATQAVMFTQAYSPTPVCAPTRAAILGGIHAARQHITHVAGGDPPSAKTSARLMAPYYSLRMEDEVISLPEELAPHGYFSGHIGKWHINGENGFPAPLDQGFDWSEPGRGISRNMGDRNSNFATTNAADAYQLDENGFAYDQITENGLAFLAEAAATNKPFFCYYASWLVHAPIQIRTESLLIKYAGLMGYDYPLTNVDLSADDQINPYYAAMVETFDYTVNRLITYLEDTDDPRWPGHKLIENTYIFFTSDNGGMEGPASETYTDNDPLQMGKKFTEEGGTRVPFLVWGPGLPTSNVVTDVMVNGLDFYPTILSLAGIPIPARLEGHDLSTLLLNDPQDASLVTNSLGEVRDTLYWHYPHNRFQSTIRKDGWKLFKNYDHVDNATVEPYSLYQLYDTNGVRNDIEEANDLYNVETNRVAELTADLEAWLVEVGASSPHYNPNYSGTLAHKSEVPAILADGHSNGVAWVTWETNKAEVVAVELIYTPYTPDGEWFDLEVSFTASTGRAEVEIPAGTAYYLFNLIDSNNFLVSSVDVEAGVFPPYDPVNLPSQDALLLQAGTHFPTGDVIIANESGTTANSKVQNNDTNLVTLAEGQTFAITHSSTITKLTLKVAEDVTYGSGDHKMALWIGSYTNYSPDASSEGTKVFEWIDFANTSITNNSFITIDFADVTLPSGTYAFQLAWPTHHPDHYANFYRGIAEYAGGERLRKQSDAGTSIFLPFSGQDGPNNRDFVFALHGDVPDFYGDWAAANGLDAINVNTAPELNTVSTGDELLRDDVGFHIATDSAWTVTNGVIGNATSETVPPRVAEGPIGQIFYLTPFNHLASSLLSLRFDYTTAQASEDLVVHLWGYEDTVSSFPTTTIMNLKGSKNGHAWEIAEPGMTAYNLGRPNGVFSGTPGVASNAAAVLTGSTGAQTYSNTFDFSSFTTAPTTVSGYDYLALGFARDTVAGAAVAISNVVLKVIGGDTILSFVLEPAATDFSADPDSDTWNNLWEYALGGDPTNDMDVGMVPEIEVTPSKYVEYIYNRRTDFAVRGLTYTVQGETNLLTNAWSTNGTVEVGSGDIGGGFERVTNHIQAVDTAFGRLKVDLAD